MGNLSLLQMTLPDDGDHVDVMMTASMCCLQLRRTLDDILDFDAIMGGSLTLEKKPFMVRDLLTTTMSQVIVAAHEKQLECNIDIDPAALYLSFISDGSRIQQVLANFGWNATKFTAQGGIVFRMRLVTTNVDNRTGELSSAVVRFEVEDTGSGVDPEVAKTLFLPFDKDTFSRQGKHGGSGLGLNICKALASILGAEIGCESVQPPGQGSIFYIQLEVPVLPVPASLVPSLEKAEAQRIERHRRSMELIRSGGDPYAAQRQADLSGGTPTGPLSGNSGPGQSGNQSGLRSRTRSVESGPKIVSEYTIRNAPEERLIEAAVARNAAAADALEATLQWAMAGGNDNAPPSPRPRELPSSRRGTAEVSRGPSLEHADDQPSLDDALAELADALGGAPFRATVLRMVESGSDVSVEVKLEAVSVGVRQAWGTARVSRDVTLSAATNAAQADALRLFARSLRLAAAAAAEAVAAAAAASAGPSRNDSVADGASAASRPVLPAAAVSYVQESILSPSVWFSQQQQLLAAAAAAGVELPPGELYPTQPSFPPSRSAAGAFAAAASAFAAAAAGSAATSASAFPDPAVPLSAFATSVGQAILREAQDIYFPSHTPAPAAMHTYQPPPQQQQPQVHVQQQPQQHQHQQQQREKEPSPLSRRVSPTQSSPKQSPGQSPKPSPVASPHSSSERLPAVAAPAAPAGGAAVAGAAPTWDSARPSLSSSSGGAGGAGAPRIFSAAGGVYGATLEEAPSNAPSLESRESICTPSMLSDADATFVPQRAIHPWVSGGRSPAPSSGEATPPHQRASSPAQVVPQVAAPSRGEPALAEVPEWPPPPQEERRKEAQRAAAAAAAANSKPASTATVVAAPAPPPPAASNSGSQRRFKVLVVDDEQVNTKLISRMLSRSNRVDVTVAFDGQDMVDLVINQGKRFDVVVMDQNMRHMNGNVACERVRIFERHRGLEPVPILITSGNNSPEDRVAYAKAGADGVIPKPIDMTSLMSDIDRIIEVREQRDVPKLVPPPPEKIEIPMRDPDAELRAKRLTPLSASMGAFPWRPSDTGPVGPPGSGR